MDGKIWRVKRPNFYYHINGHMSFHISFFFFFFNPNQIFYFFCLIRKFADFIKQGQTQINSKTHISLKSKILNGEGGGSFFQRRLPSSGGTFSTPVSPSLSLYLALSLSLSLILTSCLAPSINLAQPLCLTLYCDLVFSCSYFYTFGSPVFLYSFLTNFLCSISHQWRLAAWLLQCRNSNFFFLTL